MKLTDPVVVPDWLRRASPPAVAILLLWCAIDFLNWQSGVLSPFGRPGLIVDAGSMRCFDNVEPFMPLAAILHSVLCLRAVSPSGTAATTALSHGIAVSCLFGGVIIVFLTARTISGWWSAGIASAVAATSPFLFVLDYQMSPASLGALFGTLSCWFAVEAFCRQDSPNRARWRTLWIISFTIALGTYAGSLWLVLAQIAYAATRLLSLRRPDFAVGVSFGSAALALGTAFVPDSSMMTAVARSDVRGLPAALFAFSYPDQWLGQLHFAACLSVISITILLSGAVVARRTALPYFVAAIFVQQFVAASLSVDVLTKLTSAAYAVPVMALSIGALTEAAIRRRPHMLAFVIPAFVVAAQYAAFDRLPHVSYSSFDFDSVNRPPLAAFVSGDAVRLYHDRHHAEYVTVFESLDGLVHGTDRRIVAATTATAVTSVAPYRIYRGLYVVYSIVARDGSWQGYISGDKLWHEPAARTLIRQPFAKVRIYDKPDVPFRSDVDGTLEPVDTHFEVLDVNNAAYQPELHVRVADGRDAGREGWIYAQTLLLGSASAVN